MRAMGETIEGAVGEDGIVEEGDPFIDGAIARDDGGGVAVALDEDIVEVPRLLRGESLRRPKSSRMSRSGVSHVRSSRSKEGSARAWPRASRRLGPLMKRTRWPARQAL